MIHNISKEQYLRDPCGSSSVAYWKCSAFEKPENLVVVHERDFRAGADTANISPEKYFRLFHDLKHIDEPQSSGFFLQTVEPKTQIGLVADMLSRCYGVNYPPQTIEAWTKLRVYEADLWVFAVEKASGLPVALGIADFDGEIMEGSLEWIQVLPEKRRQNLGEFVVRGLLARLQARADFVTVSGQVDNAAKPDTLYRKCGFSGNDIWYVYKAN